MKWICLSVVLQSFTYSCRKDFTVLWYEKYLYSFLNQLFVVCFICCRKIAHGREYFYNFGIITNICNFHINTIIDRTKLSLPLQIAQWRSLKSSLYLLLERLVLFCIFSWFIDFLVEQASGAQLQHFHVYKESPLSAPLIHHKDLRFTRSFKLMLQPTCLTVSLRLGCETLVRTAYS